MEKSLRGNTISKKAEHQKETFTHFLTKFLSDLIIRFWIIEADMIKNEM